MSFTSSFRGYERVGHSGRHRLAPGSTGDEGPAADGPVVGDPGRSDRPARDAGIGEDLDVEVPAVGAWATEVPAATLPSSPRAGG
jgi:hypothetical protein